MISYKNVNYGKKSIRRNYSKVRTEVEIPNLIEIQTNSFDWCIETGLKEIFEDMTELQYKFEM